jgi:hypothetical protein
VKKLFDPLHQQAFRNGFFHLNSEDQLRNLLADNKIIIPKTDDGTPQGRPIRIIVVDVQYARMKWYPDNVLIDPVNELFYLLVMPPVPQTYDPVMQGWESAWYHAIVDGFGM